MAVNFIQNGPVNIHIKESYGGSNDIFNHYNTTYNYEYGKHWVRKDFYKEPQPGMNSQWNKRCYLGFNVDLDKYDNPFLRSQLRNNYVSVTKNDFRSPKIPYRENNIDRTNKLIVPAGYNFHTELTIPKKMHDPKDWTTHYNQEFYEKIPTTIDFHRDPIGKKEMSGFSLNHPIIGPLNMLPSTYKNDWPKTETNRPTGETTYNTVYKPYLIPNGNEPLPEIAPGSSRSSGFVKGNQQKPEFVYPVQDNAGLKHHSPNEIDQMKKNDPAEYLNAIHPTSHPSITHGTYLDPKSKPPTEEEILNRISVGDKERTGFVANEINYIQTKDNPKRFITHNFTKYYDPSLIDCERNGHVDFNVHAIPSDGFVKNNPVHTNEGNCNMSNKFAKMDAYQKRSLYKRDYVAR